MVLTLWIVCFISNQYFTVIYYNAIRLGHYPFLVSYSRVGFTTWPATLPFVLLSSKPFWSESCFIMALARLSLSHVFINSAISFLFGRQINMESMFEESRVKSAESYQAICLMQSPSHCKKRQLSLSMKHVASCVPLQRIRAALIALKIIVIVNTIY